MNQGLLRSLLPALLPLLRGIAVSGGTRKDAAALLASLLADAVPPDPDVVGEDAAAVVDDVDRAVYEAICLFIFDLIDRDDGIRARQAVFDLFDALREVGMGPDEAIDLAVKVIDHCVVWSVFIKDQTLAGTLEAVDETLGRALLGVIWWLAARIGGHGRRQRRIKIRGPR